MDQRRLYLQLAVAIVAASGCTSTPSGQVLDVAGVSTDTSAGDDSGDAASALDGAEDDSASISVDGRGADDAAADDAAADVSPTDAGDGVAPAEDVMADADDEPIDGIATDSGDTGTAADINGDAGLDAGDEVDAADTTPVCVPQCTDMECGDDGCGGICGKCPAAAPDCVGGTCLPACTATCDGKTCGDDGCGGDCGICQAANYCAKGACTPGFECAALSKCVTPCKGDQACLDACFADASIDGLLALSELQGCILDKCFDASNPLQCTAASCIKEYVACYAGGPGTGTCNELVKCTNPCAGDLVCMGLCESKATLSATGGYLTYLACVAAACPKGAPSGCAAQALGPGGACQAAFESCIAN